MKIDRLMGIVVYLLNHGRTSAQKLAEAFEVSSRTIMRDLEALDRAGIPIQSFCGADGGYQIMENFVLEKQAVTNHEYDWMVTALKGLVSAYANKGLEQTLAKISSLQPAEENAVSVDFSIAREDGRINEQLALLETAIQEKRRVRFAYTNSQDERKEIQLVRMEHLEVTDSKNTKEHAISEIPQKDSNEKVVHIRLYGKASIKAKCREYLNGKITQEFENGDFEFCFSAPEYETFWFGVILSFGSKAKIIEPQAIRERIVRTCEEIQKEYEESRQ